jgi:hypothetical protein
LAEAALEQLQVNDDIRWGICLSGKFEGQFEGSPVFAI